MTVSEIVTPKFISMKGHPELHEKWLQNHLTEHPELLQLGPELEVLKTEHRQPTGGRLDLLLQDAESETRYEVEIQLGAVDESHIIRTIEYWDVERRRFPRHEHIAVIVAEDVTSRFLNVISLFNRTIPLIAIQLKAVEVNGSLTLVATRVIDLMPLGTEEDETQETTNRAYWERKASPESLRLVDNMVKLIRNIHPGIEPKYNKNYIGLLVGGNAKNFVEFVPKKNHVIARFRLPQDETQSGEIEDAGLVMLSYDKNFGRYKVRLVQQDLEAHRDFLLELARKARQMLG